MLRNPLRRAGRRGARRVGRTLGCFAAILLGLAGMAAGPAEGQVPPGEDIKDMVRRTVERVLEDSADAGPAPRATRPVGFAPSPEPEAPDGGADAGLPSFRRLPEPDPEGGRGRAVVIVEISDVIDMGVSAFVKRAIEENREAAALILDINTPGGRVDAATEVRDAVMNAPEGMRTVAFIHPRAISAGAFISLACDLVFIAEGGSIGAATPIAMGGGEVEAVDEKMVSYFRTEMAATARAKGRRGDIAEAMVDAEVEIEGITPAGKLLTLDTAGALRLGIADARASSMDEVLEALALPRAERREMSLNWAEVLARLFTHPVLSGILMSVGVLGILIELYQPGFGLPGIVGLTALVVFFAGHLVVHLAGLEEVLLFLLGVILLFVEVFVTPGFGVVGALGVAAVISSLVLSLSSLPVGVSFDTGVLADSILRVLGSIVAAGALFAAAVLLLPKTPLRGKLILETAIDSRSDGGLEGAVVKEAVASGETGVAESFLRPAGIARFGGRRVDVVSEGDFVEVGEEVEIVRVSGNRVVVRKKET